MDFTRVQPAARPIVEPAANVYLRHLHPWLLGIVLHGSAYKGGYIPGSSDVDFKLYLRDDAFVDEEALSLPLALAIQRDLLPIDCTPFRAIQSYALPPRNLQRFTAPVPGSYLVLYGELPVAEATADEVLTSDRQRLTNLQPVPARLSAALIDHGERRLSREARLICTDVWPTLIAMISVMSNDPFRAWNMNKLKAVELLPANTSTGAAIREFYAAALAYYPAEANSEDGLRLIELGVAFLQAVKDWWAQQ